jgi:tellurite resistance protein
MRNGVGDEVALTVLVLMTLVDGSVDEEEIIRMRWIHGRIVGHAVSEAEVRATIARVRDEPPELTAYLERVRDRITADDRHKLLLAAFAIAIADGRVRDEEDAMMLGIAKALAIPPQEYRAVCGQLRVARELGS